ncbi:MAG: dihydrolipoyl dehydrogenase [Dongiaceae bacterium]
MADQYDVAIIGGGPAGYVAAIRAAQLGMRTVCIEKRGALGGTCLNVGCIPSKALLHASERYEEAKGHLAPLGIRIGSVDLDLAAMLAHKDKVVTGLTRGIESLFKKHRIDYLKGSGRLAGSGRVDVALADGGRTSLAATSIVIATGSEPTSLPGITIDEKRIVSSTGALILATVPTHLVVIGAGYIGLEMGSVWRRLGSKVTVVEYLDRILPGMDKEIAKQFQRILERQGMKFRLATKVTAASSSSESVSLTFEPAAGGAAETLLADCVLVAVGRRPFTEELGLEEAGVALDDKGRVRTDAHFQTSAAGIYAIGDVIAGPMLAHKAMDEGVALMERLAGQAGHVNYETVPGIVFTWPEVASVGRTEEQLKEAGIEYRVGKFPFMANSRSRTTGETDGFVKLLADAKTDRLLGAHILGPDAGTLIHECVVAMEFGGAVEDLARSFHGHPTLSESIKEAALAAGTGAIHI